MNLRDEDLYKKHDDLINLKTQTYEKLYQRCNNNIKLTSNAGELMCLFEIPNFLFGSSYPIINVKCCAKYLMNKLTEANKNIRVTFIEPNMLFIDWRRPEDMPQEITPKISNSKKKTRKSRK
ncbi:hypothetical protein H012_gp558 [Acanthamoeba polyphaga moumouvirus]|uniref:Uncharacterized protein n=1 Tax=Acanthamoeba polyphaga moumouvirus TaxID=1269028 RepID=L7RBL8_9VIRU|nr:hypothetical protein H012_gp558 [Acanthamoeba polyphaga moumouvirus]AGC01904.1 hypothetical protein Moumou_00366 [Acanthamoeba polyphaga moumouvirus]